jgi:hypothetical protein
MNASPSIVTLSRSSNGGPAGNPANAPPRAKGKLAVSSDADAIFWMSPCSALGFEGVCNCADATVSP